MRLWALPCRYRLCQERTCNWILRTWYATLQMRNISIVYSHQNWKKLNFSFSSKNWTLTSLFTRNGSARGIFTMIASLYLTTLEWSCRKKRPTKRGIYLGSVNLIATCDDEIWREVRRGEIDDNFANLERSVQLDRANLEFRYQRCKVPNKSHLTRDSYTLKLKWAGEDNATKFTFRLWVRRSA